MPGARLYIAAVNTHRRPPISPPINKISAKCRARVCMPCRHTHCSPPINKCVIGRGCLMERARETAAEILTDALLLQRRRVCARVGVVCVNATQDLQAKPLWPRCKKLDHLCVHVHITLPSHHTTDTHIETHTQTQTRTHTDTDTDTDTDTHTHTHTHTRA